MKNIRLSILLVALATSTSACGDADAPASPATDSGTTALDTGLPTPDTGTTPEDTGATPTDTGTTSGNVPGKVVHEEMVDGAQREFIVYVPEKAKGTTPVPVVFIVHGTSQDGEHFYTESKWKEKSDAEGIITVFPTALTYCYSEDENADGDFVDPGERRVSTKWDAGKLGDPTVMPLCTPAQLAELTPAARAKADHPIKDDVAFFKFMLDFLGKKYSYDAKRVYATGFSNGASMTSRLGNDMPDRFAAVAAHAGAMAVTPKAAAKPITFLFSLGNLDDRFSAKPIPIGESLITTPGFSKIVAEYLVSANIASTYVYDEPKAGAKSMSRFRYTTSNVGATNSVTAVLIEGCFHQYPNGINHPLVMADALWELFKTRTVP